MNFLKKLLEQFFYLILLILLELLIAYFLRNNEERFDEFMGVSLIIDILVFAGSFIMAGSYSKNIRKYKRKLGVDSYTPLFYCIPLGDGGGNIFHAAGLFTKNSLIFCRVTNDMSHDLVSDFWESIEEDFQTVPFSSIRDVAVIKAQHDNYAKTKREASIKDLIRNQTLGRLMRNNQKTIVFAAFIYIRFQGATGQDYELLFGIGENTSSPGLSMLIEPALPGWVDNTIAVTETAAELADTEDGSEEFHVAKKVAANLIAKVNLNAI